MNFNIPVLGFAAASGTGKTTLLTAILPRLKNQGLRIAVIKHSHHNFEIDQPGKDSYKLRAAGACSMILVSPYRRVQIDEFDAPAEPMLIEQLARVDCSVTDLVLVEGFKHEAIPKIEVHRKNLAHRLLYPEDPQIIAVASDEFLALPPGIHFLDLNNGSDCARFVIDYINNFPKSLI